MQEIKSRLFGKEEQEKKTPEKTTYSISKKSAASAKPSREKAYGVRVGGKSSKAPVEMTKEEKRQARREYNEEQDRVTAVASILLKKNPTYVKYRKIWWTAIALGIASIVLSFFTLNYTQYGLPPVLYNFSLPLLILAYAGVFGAFIFDMFKIRPLRKQSNNQATGLTLKKQLALIEEEQSKKTK